MNYLLIAGLAILLLAIVVGFRLGWELLQQNGRMLLRLEALEKRLDELASVPQSKFENQNSKLDEPARANRFGNHSLANSKIKRDGLKAGTAAPEFRLPRLEGGELSLSELRGRLVLLVFSSPQCGPCNLLAPKVQEFHRKHPELELVMISQHEPEENRAKVREQGLTFPIILQKQWEVSRDYAYFATPVAYLIDESGVIAADVAVGGDGVVDLMARVKRMFRRKADAANTAWLKRVAESPVRPLRRLFRPSQSLGQSASLVKQQNP